MSCLVLRQRVNCTGCYALWCWPCFLCSLANAMGECSVGPWLCHTNPSACCCMHTFIPSCVNPFLFAMRSKLRAQYGIEVSTLLCVGLSTCNLAKVSRVMLPCKFSPTRSREARPSKVTLFDALLSIKSSFLYTCISYKREQGLNIGIIRSVYPEVVYRGRRTLPVRG